ncbi:MAG: hypothetical protein M4579_001731 [Chaenotheca gracillima]|nr:MAG: hypothetical protein M4579_001731 [Chaenotheca gracillima]
MADSQSKPTVPIMESSSDANPGDAQAPGEMSANAQKKLAKAQEKEAKKAAKKAEQEQKRLAEQKQVEPDFSAEQYGNIHKFSSEAQSAGPEILTLRSLILQGGSYVDKTITIHARVQTARSQTAKLAFLLLREESEASIQAVIAAGGDDGVSRQMVKWVASISQDSIVEVTGVVKEPKEPVSSATVSHFELHIRKCYVIAASDSQLPIQFESGSLPELGEGEEEAEAGDESKTSRIPRVSLKTQLDHRTLSLRWPLNRAIFRIKSGVFDLFYEYMKKHEFVQIWTPKLISAASEGGSNVFEVTYFGRKAYLAQSPQLYKQMAIGGDNPRVFEIGPVFRAENSNTHRHMTEFIGLDLEMSFSNHYHEVLDFLEGLFVYILNGLKERYADDIAAVRKQYPVEEFKIPEHGKMLRLKFADGIKMLRDAGEELGDYDDLSTPHEKLLGKLVREKYDTDFYILDEFPLGVRPFYTMPSPKNPKLSNSYDFFMRGEEIMSGAQRVHEHALLVERIKSMGIDPQSDGLKDYVDSFKYGVPPHAGGGIGLDRVVMLYLGLGNIRKASMFPRDPQRLRP